MGESSASGSASASAPVADLRSMPERAARRIAGIFYSPDVSLSRRQQTVFARLEDAPPLAAAPDHGYLYGLTAADVAGASEAVRRALSTRTGSLADMRKFRAADIVKRFGATETDSGASRVQGERMRERVLALKEGRSFGAISNLREWASDRDR